MKSILKNFDFCVKIFIITGTQYALLTYTYIRSTIHVNCLKKLVLLILCKQQYYLCKIIINIIIILAGDNHVIYLLLKLWRRKSCLFHALNN